MPARSPEEIRRSLQSTRTELEYSLNDLQGKVHQLTNWRRQLTENKQTAIIAAGVAVPRRSSRVGPRRPDPARRTGSS